MITLKDIAVQVGVDVSTVSKVLQGAPIRISPSKREQIERVAREMHYRPNTVARGLRLRKSGAVAMVVLSTANYLYPEIIGGAEDAADEHGYVLFLVKQSMRNPAEQLLSIVTQGRVDGLLFADELPSAGFLDRLLEQGVPFVSLNRDGPECQRFVSLDDEAGFDAQAEYLASLGHRNVAFVGITPQSYVSQLCHTAFVESARRRGMDCPGNHQFRCDFVGEGAEQIADRILTLDPRPTAVATASILVASKLVEIFEDRGVSVPEAISVLGYHESPTAVWLRPGISTVKMPSRVQGCRGMTRLLELIGGSEYPGEIIEVKPEILERGTCTQFVAP